MCRMAGKGREGKGGERWCWLEVRRREGGKSETIAVREGLGLEPEARSR